MTAPELFKTNNLSLEIRKSIKLSSHIFNQKTPDCESRRVFPDNLTYFIHN